MIFQIIFYISLTIIIDCYYSRIQAIFGHIGYLLSLPLKCSIQSTDDDHGSPGSSTRNSNLVPESIKLNEARDDESFDFSLLPSPLLKNKKTPLIQSIHKNYNGVTDNENDHDNNDTCEENIKSGKSENSNISFLTVSNKSQRLSRKESFTSGQESHPTGKGFHTLRHSPYRSPQQLISLSASPVKPYRRSGQGIYIEA